MFVPTVFTLLVIEKDSFSFELSVSGSSSSTGGTRNEEIKDSSFSALLWIYSKQQSTHSCETKWMETHRKSL